MFIHTIIVAAVVTLAPPAPAPTYYPYATPLSQQQPDTGKHEPKRKPPPASPPKPKTPPPAQRPAVKPAPPPPKVNPPPKGQPELRRRKPS